MEKIKLSGANGSRGRRGIKWRAGVVLRKMIVSDFTQP